MDSFFDNLPEIIDKSSSSPLALIALICIIMGTVAVILFRKSQKPKIQLGAFAILTIGLIILSFKLISLNDEVNHDKRYEEGSIKLEITTEKPIVIGIYPSNAFGPNQKKGLKCSMAHLAKDVELIHLDFLTIDQMKKGEGVDKLNDSLSFLLKRRNVLAISGPPVTECTSIILNTVKNSGSKVPVIISTAASKQTLNWASIRQSVNVYRISSGMEDRANSLARVLKTTDDFGETAVFIERNSNVNGKTYGEQFYDMIYQKSDEFERLVEHRKIKKFYYEKNDGFEGFDHLFSEEMANFKFIFVLGAGNEFGKTVDKYYTGDYASESVPKLGGWMFGYVANEYLGKSSCQIVGDKIFEITDVNFSRSSLESSKNLRWFKLKFGLPHPGLRDEAFSFDAGVCISAAYSELKGEISIPHGKYIKFDKNAFKALNNFLSKPKTHFEGVSRQFSFVDGTAPNFSMNTAILKANCEWARINPEDLIEL